MNHRVMPPDEGDDAPRVARAVREAQLIKLDALANAPLGAGSRDRQDVLRLRDKLHAGRVPLTGKEVETIARLAWKWRRAIPHYLSPRLPPHDPIVREMEAARV